MPDTPSSNRALPRCVVLVPVGPGHEALAREARASVEFAFQQNPGPFAEVIVLTLDDTQGLHGRSRRRNDGIAWAQSNGFDWIFFLDADDLMAANAFGEVSGHLADSDAVFGLIVEQSGDEKPQLRAGQLGASSKLVDILRNDPYLTLQMGHFVRTKAAAAIGFDASMDTGEDFKYYLELWRAFRCHKIERALFVNRRGLHSTGPRSADGGHWREAVARVFTDFCARHNIRIVLRHEGKEARFLFGNPMESVQAQISSGRFCDAAELDYLRALLPARPRIIDIAPNVGNHVIYFGVHMQASHITPLGASASEAGTLRRNVELNGLGGTVDVARLETDFDPAVAGTLEGSVDLVRIGDSAGLPALQSLTGFVSRTRPVLFVSVPDAQVDGLLLWAGEQDYRVLRSSARRGVQSHVLVPAQHSSVPATAMTGVKAFVITLLDVPESVSVANRAVASAQRHGFQTEIFPATDKSGSRAEMQRLGLKVKHLDPALSNSDAVLGLFVSSFRVWQKIAEELDHGIVVEHDAIFTAPLPDLRGKGDIVNLGKPSWGSYNLKATPGVYELFSKSPQPGLGIVMPGAHAYFLSKAGARLLMQRAIADGAAPCDLFLNNMAFPEIREIYPWIAVAVDSFSTIQKQRGSVSKHNFSDGYRVLDNSAPRRVAVVTPYYKEPREYLERCLASVRSQTHGAEHIVVADGHPQDWLDTAGVRHVRLDRAHADYGNTPRSIGAQLAASEGFDAVAFLDADNWFEPDHIATCMEAMQHTEADFVSGQRHWVRADGSRMPYRAGEDVDGSHVDTNCLVLGRGAFHTISRWLTMPKQMVLWGDRIYLASLRQEGLREARTSVPTVNYLCTWSGVFRAIGEVPPAYTKEGVPIQRMLDWLQGLQPQELALAQRLSGCDPMAFFQEREAKQGRPPGHFTPAPKMVVVSFYTKTWEYEQRARALMSACRTFQLPFDIQEVADTGKWRTNTALKPAYIRRMLDQHEHILWLDCDGTLFDSPVECLKHPDGVDILACPHRTVAGRDWHVGILSIRSNDRTRAFVDAWIAQIRRHIEHETTDEFAFIQVMKNHPEVVFQALPGSYHVVMNSHLKPAGTIYGLGISRDEDKLRTYQNNDRLAFL